MKTKVRAALSRLIPHKYAIDASSLGDDKELAWTNLGFWQNTQNYREACCQLADHLAQAVNLNSKDHLLDLGCGQGASLLHWLQYYQPKSLSAVELQAQCVNKIQKFIPEINQVFCSSFLNLKQFEFKQYFDVVLCIDAAYHSHLNSFLDSVTPVLNSKGRLGFHYLMRADSCQNMTVLQEQKHRYLLKAADVAWDAVPTEKILRTTLEQQGFIDIQIEDLSEQVLLGFSQYIQNQQGQKQSRGLANFKIQMTAKLCQQLYQNGYVRYIQIIAIKK
ncbi:MULTISPECIES: SAM-dependent methyltransferase [Acinetobacter]|uniref:SAM-dependent methyltransferase n=1 Tax=Acinetobacter TaxID=469 RepID=UPI00029C9B17|nr:MULTISPECIES: class I SAM-dependent methyltransferase [Acinetobacter]EKU38072.1 methyltransferase domain protein [Acinetobacter sp. WC-141]MBM7141702.1 class I SAM-dependent methyltransferase [Acinetobacter sp. 105-3]